MKKTYLVPFLASLMMTLISFRAFAAEDFRVFQLEFDRYQQAKSETQKAESLEKLRRYVLRDKHSDQQVLFQIIDSKDENYREQFELAIGFGANIRKIRYDSDANTHNRHENVLDYAVRMDDKKMVEAVFKSPQANSIELPIRDAAFNGSMNSLELLVEKLPEGPDRERVLNSALGSILIWQNPWRDFDLKVARILLDNGASPSRLFNAATMKNEYFPIALMMIEHGHGGFNLHRSNVVQSMVQKLYDVDVVDSKLMIKLVKQKGMTFFEAYRLINEKRAKGLKEENDFVEELLGMDLNNFLHNVGNSPVSGCPLI